MNSKTSLFLILVTVCFSWAAKALDDLPRPLPDGPLPSQPTPAPTQPQPPVVIAPEPEVKSYSFGVTQLQGYAAGTYQFLLHPEIGELAEVSVHGIEDNIEIREVRVFSSEIYLIRSLNELTGVLYAGQSRVSGLSPAAIRRIEVVASAPSFWKRPGHFRLDIVTVKNR